MSLEEKKIFAMFIILLVLVLLNIWAKRSFDKTFNETIEKIEEDE